LPGLCYQTLTLHFSPPFFTLLTGARDGETAATARRQSQEDEREEEEKDTAGADCIGRR
jgi:hypothetical protein